MLALAATGCGGGGAVKTLGRLHAVEQTCPKDATASAYVALDGRGALRGPQLTKGRLAALKSAAEKVAVCGGGRLKVVVFGPSPAATVVVFDSQLHPAGATTNARFLRIPAIVADTLRMVETELPAAFRQLTPDGADPVAQLTLARDFAQQLEDGGVVFVLIETSGMTRVATPGLTPEMAKEFGEHVTTPDLDGAFVTIAGLGHVGSGAPPSTGLVDAIHTYYSTVCQRTGATCRALSDIVVGS